MLSVDESNFTNQTASHSIFDNINKIFTTFIPTNRRESNELLMSIGPKSYGTITFTDNKSNRAQFIRIEKDASVAQVKELLNRQWCRERPSLVISVTGGAKDYNMKPKLLRAFRRGLLKVARTTGAWIITGGMNTGIMKLVGEIVQINPDRSRPIHLIGIATWGCVSGFPQLDVRNEDVQYIKPRVEEKGEAPIEPNHTEFIFIDDGTVRKYGGEIAFRARLERAIAGDFFGSRLTTHAGHSNTGRSQSVCPEPSDPVPVVLLVVEGGPNTVRTVHEAVVENNIPAVFFEGTGRCCDLFSKAYHLYKMYRQKYELPENTSHLDPQLVERRKGEIKHKLHEDLMEELYAISGASDTPRASNNKVARRSTSATASKKPRAVDTTDYFQLVYECLDTRFNFLNVISFNPRSSIEPDIDLAILRALLNATSGVDASKPNDERKREQFQLALEWNRVDIARDFIMKDERDWDTIDLNDKFLYALSHNQTGFVKLFLDHDFSLTNVFQDNDILPALYMNSTRQRYTFNSIATNTLRAIYEEIIQPLIGDIFEVEAVLHPKVYATRSQIDENAYQGCCGRKRTTNNNNDLEGGIERTASIQSEIAAFNNDCHFDVDKELFVWSVITGRRDFNLLFWARGKNKICAALLAALIYRKRARKDNDNSYSASADEFENLAVQILDKFHQINSRACTKAIIRRIPAYGNVTWLELAIKAEAKEFIAQRAVQDVLNNIWFGYIDQREKPRSIIFCTFVFWCSGFLRFHDELVKTTEQPTFLDEVLGKSKLFQERQAEAFKQGKEKTGNDVHMRLMHGINYEDDNPVEFVPVGCFEKTTSGIARYFRNLIKFIRAPYVKYLYSLYFHVIFLTIFSYLMLCDFYPLNESQLGACPSAVNMQIPRNDHAYHSITDHGNQTSFASSPGPRIRSQPSILEYLLAVWIFTLFCEETRQFFSSEAYTLRNKITTYFDSFWNLLDFIAIFLFYTGFFLRFVPVAECFCAARIVLSIDLCIWFLRVLNIFTAVKQLGPKLVMIGEMAYDLKVYVVMLIVFILGFGVSSYSLTYDAEPFNWHLPRELLNHAYWQIFGEINTLDTFKDNYKATGYAMFILLIVYMAIVSILLVNLLIAMFSNTFDRLQTDTDRIWKFQRYSLICEYLSRPSLPPPLICLSHLWRFILYAVTPCINSPWLRDKYIDHSNRTKYKIFLDEKSASNIEAAEDAIGDEVYYNYLKMGRKLVEDNVTDEERIQTPQEILFNKVRKLEDRMHIMSNQQAHVIEYLDCLLDGLKQMGGDQIKAPEKRRYDPDESMDEAPIPDIDPVRSFGRREAPLRDVGRQSSVQTDDQQSSIINLYLSSNRKD